MTFDFLDQAIRMTQEHLARGGGGPFGCIIVKDGVVIGKGVNQVTELHDPTAHAEVQAIREACAHLESHQLGGCTLYATCEPCPMCLGAIYWARVDLVIYASTREDAAAVQFDDALIYEEIARDPESRRIPMRLDAREQARDLFREWKSSRYHIPY